MKVLKAILIIMSILSLGIFAFLAWCAYSCYMIGDYERVVQISLFGMLYLIYPCLVVMLIKQPNNK